MGGFLGKKKALVSRSKHEGQAKRKEKGF